MTKFLIRYLYLSWVSISLRLPTKTSHFSHGSGYQLLTFRPNYTFSATTPEFAALVAAAASISCFDTWIVTSFVTRWSIFG